MLGLAALVQLPAALTSGIWRPASGQGKNEETVAATHRSTRQALAQPNTTTLHAVPASTTGRPGMEALAREISSVVPASVRVRVSGTDPHGRAFVEYTAVEYGSPTDVIFSSALPLQRGDKLRVVGVDGSFDATGTVLATRYHYGKSAVAVRFREPILNCPFKRR